MFSRKFRLPATTSFHKAKFYNSLYFSAKVQQNSLQYNRYGFVVSKKISKRAHIRNRTKRRFRACIEHFHTQLLSGYDMLFVLKAASVSEEKVICQEIKNTLKSLFLH